MNTFTTDYPYLNSVVSVLVYCLFSRYRRNTGLVCGIYEAKTYSATESISASE